MGKRIWLFAPPGGAPFEVRMTAQPFGGLGHE